MSQEARSQAPKFLDRIRRIKTQTRMASPLLSDRSRKRRDVQFLADSIGGGFRGVHNRDIRRQDALEQRFDQRIVGTAQQEHVSGTEIVGEGFIDVNAGNLLSDWMFHPS